MIQAAMIAGFVAFVVLVYIWGVWMIQKKCRKRHAGASRYYYYRG
ncbi:MAG: hypothetical protein ACK4UN_12585 [Limisphaerales bacterium]